MIEGERSKGQQDALTTFAAKLLRVDWSRDDAAEWLFETSNEVPCASGSYVIMPEHEYRKLRGWS